MLTVGIYGIPDDGQKVSPDGNTHDHGVSVIKDGKVLSMTQLERYTQRKHDNRLPLYLPELLSKLIPKTEKMQIISANSFLDSKLVSADGTFSLIPETKPKIADILTPSVCLYDGKRIPAWTICHEFGHIAACLPFVGEFKENSLLVHIDGGAYDSASSVWQYESGSPNYLHSSWDDLKDMANNFNSSPLMQAILGLNKEDHLSMPGKLMGYASYGNSSDSIRDWLIDNNWFLSYSGDSDGILKEINLKYNKNFKDFDQHEQLFMDIAATIQSSFEDSVVNYLCSWRDKTGSENLYYSGGAGLNILTNQRIELECGFKSIFIPPCTSDGGLALGAAAWKEYVDNGKLSLHSPYLDTLQAPVDKNPLISPEYAAKLISEGKTLGLCLGGGEVGPRALCHRSILARPDNIELRRHVSEIIKKREWYRPLAPVILSDVASMIIKEDFSRSSLPKYMLGSFTVKPEYHTAFSGVIHADETIRAQIVYSNDPHTDFIVSLLKELVAKYNILGLIQTSFNSKGMPLVQTSSEALEVGEIIGLDVVIT